jgi:hypothetical protein
MTAHQQSESEDGNKGDDGGALHGLHLITRWITRAPVFMLTAGLGAFFGMNRGHRSKGELSRFLVTWYLCHIPRAHPATHDHVFPDQLPRKSRDPDHPLGYRLFSL